MDSSLEHFWDDFFFNPEESIRSTGEISQHLFRQYTKGVKAIVNSLNAPVGLTPKEEIWRLNKTRLYRYQSNKTPENRYTVPILLVYALINKPFIFDLVPDRSFISYLVSEGFDVYLLDWGIPGIEDKNTTFDDYVTEYLARAVRKMLRVSGADSFSMLGYCIGATLATVYAAYFPGESLRNLILLTAPLDFSGPAEGSLAIWFEEGRINIDKLVDTFGNVPGEFIREWAKMLKPMENFVGAYVNLMKILGDQTAVQGWQAINRWVEDVIPFAGEAFRQFVHCFIHNNELINGTHLIKGKPVDLANINAAILNVIAQYDHLVSPNQSKSIMDLVSSKDKTLQVIPSTHVGIMASSRAQYKLWPQIVSWLSERSSV